VKLTGGGKGTKRHSEKKEEVSIKRGDGTTHDIFAGNTDGSHSQKKIKGDLGV